MAGLTAVSIAMVRAVFGMALRRGLLLVAMVLLLPVGMLLRRALALPLGFLLLLMLAAKAVILFGALTLGMALLIDLALTALLLLVLTLTLRLLLVSLLLGLLVALALVPLTLPLRICPFLPDMLVTLAVSGLFLLARLMLALGLPLLGDTLLHMLVARSFGAMVLSGLRLGAVTLGIIGAPLPARTTLLPMAGGFCRHGEAKPQSQREPKPGGALIIPHSVAPVGSLCPHAQPLLVKLNGT